MFTCTVTGMMYIGQSSQKDVTMRWRQHRCASQQKDTHLYRAVKKYGWDLFKIELLLCCPNDQLDAWETHFIAKLDTYRNGLNMTPGGQHCSPMLCPELKAKRMATMREPDVRQRWLISITKAQQKPEQRALLSKLCKERCQDPDHMKKREAGRKRHIESLDEAGRHNVIERMATPQAKAKRVKHLKATLASKDGKARHSAATKATWQNPDSRARRMAGLKEAAKKRIKPKPAKVPYDKERRKEAMQRGWLKRKGLTVAAFEQRADAPAKTSTYAKDESPRWCRSGCVLKGSNSASTGDTIVACCEREYDPVSETLVAERAAEVETMRVAMNAPEQGHDDLRDEPVRKRLRAMSPSLRETGTLGERWRRAHPGSQ